MTRAALALVSLVPLAAGGCTALRVESSAVRTGPRLGPSARAVAVSATRTPDGAQELGLVEASGRVGAATLEDLTAEFRARVGALGGDYGRIDAFRTRFDLVQQERTYECGTTETTIETSRQWQMAPDGTSSFVDVTVPVTRYVSKTCTETCMVEVATRTFLGRAFRTGGAP